MFEWKPQSIRMLTNAFHCLVRVHPLARKSIFKWLRICANSPLCMRLFCTLRLSRIHRKLDTAPDSHGTMHGIALSKDWDDNRLLECSRFLDKRSRKNAVFTRDGLESNSLENCHTIQISTKGGQEGDPQGLIGQDSPISPGNV
jgi:hypothetical protein